MRPLLIAILLAGCAPGVGPAPPIGTQAIVEANPDSRRLLATLRQRGLPAVPRDPSELEWLSDAPGHAYQVGEEWLHIHVYRDGDDAAAAQARLLAQSRSRTAMIHWVGQPHAFRCGAAVGMFLGANPVVLGIIDEQCGSVTSLGG